MERQEEPLARLSRRRTTGEPVAAQAARCRTRVRVCRVTWFRSRGHVVQGAVATGEGLEAAFDPVGAAHDAFMAVVGVDGLQDPMGGAGPGADSGVAGPQLLQHRTLAVGESGCLAREGLPSGCDLGGCGCPGTPASPGCSPGWCTATEKPESSRGPLNDV